jgi:hypothetical protein
MMRFVAAVLLMLSFAGAVAAQPLQLVGEAQLKFLFWSVYNSRLYSADGGYQDGQRPLRLEIQYLLDADARDLIARTREEWSHQGVDLELQEQWSEQLAVLWPDVRSDDTLALVIDTQGASTFFFNDEALGVIEDPRFGARFLDIWLSSQTSQPELRLALLGRD